jgi:hypothetical protein
MGFGDDGAIVRPLLSGFDSLLFGGLVIAVVGVTAIAALVFVVRRIKGK